MAIGAFAHKGLEELFYRGRSRRIRQDMHNKCIKILDLLNSIGDLSDLEGVMNFHQLTGNRRGTYALNVTGNYRITFTWDKPDVNDVNLEDYH